MKKYEKSLARDGRIIDQIENTLGLHIDVRELEIDTPKTSKRRRYGAENKVSQQKPRPTDLEKGETISSAHPFIEINKKHLILKVPEFAGKDVEIFIEDKYLFSASVSRHGEVKLRVNSEIASDIIEAQNGGDLIEIRLI